MTKLNLAHPKLKLFSHTFQVGGRLTSAANSALLKVLIPATSNFSIKAPLLSGVNPPPPPASLLTGDEVLLCEEEVLVFLMGVFVSGLGVGVGVTNGEESGVGDVERERFIYLRRPG